MAEVPDDQSIGTLFSRLIEDVERFVRAEIRMYRAQLFSRLDDAKIAIVLLGISLSLAQAAVIALLVGLVLVLRRPVGPAWATVIVVGGALVIVGILAKLALNRIGKVTEIKEKNT